VTSLSNLPTISVPALLDRYGLRPDRSLGQNFLADDVALSNVVAAAELSEEDEVLEIGPGLGSLTRRLAQAAGQVVAVEIDGRLIPALLEILASFSNIRIVAGDILALRPADLVTSPGYRVVANIPYYITSALMRHLLEADPRPSRMVLTVQREVADRICANPGKMSLLALSVQVYGHPVIKAQIPAGAFYPPPQVDSAVIRVDLYREPLIPASELDLFFRLAKAGFSQKRKTLKNALSAGLALEKENVEALLLEAGIEPNRRAETLSLDEWGKLVRRYDAQK
jgi:16S rRNA (adenine1518-N6/adenine1519-N6)-dimethyltransferase